MVSAEIRDIVAYACTSRCDCNLQGPVPERHRQCVVKGLAVGLCRKELTEHAALAVETATELLSEQVGQLFPHCVRNSNEIQIYGIGITQAR
jgi:hypothetical protein